MLVDVFFWIGGICYILGLVYVFRFMTVECKKETEDLRRSIDDVANASFLGRLLAPFLVLIVVLVLLVWPFIIILDFIVRIIRKLNGG